MPTFAEKNFGDCSKAVAYALNFVQMCYSYGSDCYDDYYDCCQYCDSSIRQSRDYEYPKSTFSKKDYYILDTYDFGVSEKMKNEMMSFGISEENFRPIYTRKHDVPIGYQITPVNKLPCIDSTNAMELKSYCPHCQVGLHEVIDDRSIEAYGGLFPPYYISEEVFSKMTHINKIETDVAACTVFISLELYNYLLEIYPRLECRPVFIGDVKNDPEYKRVTKS